MSTPLLDSHRFANLKDSVMHYGLHGLTASTATMESAMIFRAFKLDTWGRDGPSNVNAAVNLSAAMGGLRDSVSAAIYDWQRLNWAAHCVRYDQAAEFWQHRAGTPQPSPRLPNGEILTLPQLLKALRALRYNCDGGKLASPSAIASLEALDELIAHLKDFVLDMLPEYRDAEWAI